jgi:hypothetical protein
VTFIADPYGNSYGYSTANAADIEANPAVAPTHGYNPDYDLWSTSGTTAQGAWVKNW